LNADGLSVSVAESSANTGIATNTINNEIERNNRMGISAFRGHAQGHARRSHLLTRPGAANKKIRPQRLSKSICEAPGIEAIMNSRALFIAGATGAVGQRVVAQAIEQNLSFVPHARSKSVTKLVHPKAVSFELGDSKLVDTLKSCTTVIQLIGTMRKRFAAGDTYESSDIGTTRQLVEAAKAAGSIDHLVLLSSTGAGKPMGAYLQAKAEAERLVRESGIAYTILRPSAFADREGVFVPGLKTITRVLGLKRFEPITLNALASAILRVATQRAPLGVALEGHTLWAEVHEHR
jgi:dTDP-4-dehydrorhamnose reductase